MEVEILDQIAYPLALEMQERAVVELAQGRGAERLFLLEHPPVYTMGRHLDRSSIPPGGVPGALFEVNRGGQATYHGPGQLIGYPIINLSNRGRDLHRYLRFLEEFLIQILSSFGIAACQREGLTGVWVGDRKIASIGVGVRRWISMHGFALNVCNDLTPFQQIVPCGLAGVEMTSMEQEIGVPIPVQVVAARAMDHFADELEKALPLRTA